MGQVFPSSTGQAGKLNTNADALSKSPQAPAPSEGIVEEETHVAVVQTKPSESSSITSLLESSPRPVEKQSFAVEQSRDPEVQELKHFLEKQELPTDEERARHIMMQSSLFALMDDVLYYLDPKQEHWKRVVLPRQLRQRILNENQNSQPRRFMQLSFDIGGGMGCTQTPFATVPSVL